MAAYNKQIKKSQLNKNENLSRKNKINKLPSTWFTINHRFKQQSMRPLSMTKFIYENKKKPLERPAVMIWYLNMIWNLYSISLSLSLSIYKFFIKQSNWNIRWREWKRNTWNRNLSVVGDRIERYKTRYRKPNPSLNAYFLSLSLLCRLAS